MNECWDATWKSRVQNVSPLKSMWLKPILNKICWFQREFNQWRKTWTLTNLAKPSLNEYLFGIYRPIIVCHLMKFESGEETRGMLLERSRWICNEQDLIWRSRSLWIFILHIVMHCFNECKGLCWILSPHILFLIHSSSKIASSAKG